MAAYNLILSLESAKEYIEHVVLTPIFFSDKSQGELTDQMQKIFDYLFALSLKDV